MHIRRLVLGSAVSISLLTGLSIAHAQTNTSPTECKEVSGFQIARWQCYDGKESGGFSESCMTSEHWQKKAFAFCNEGNKHCNADGSKCGVNSFSVSGDCTTKVCPASPPSCPSFEEEAKKCKLNGQTYKEYKDDKGCVRARCADSTTSSCLSIDETARQIQACKEKGGEPKFVGQGSCTTKVECGAKQHSCPGLSNVEEVNKRVRECSVRGGYHAVPKKDANGCVIDYTCELFAGNSAEVSCKKRTENGCVKIKCEDGFTYDSCSGQQRTTVPPPAPMTYPYYAGPCAELEKKVHDIRNNPTDPELMKAKERVNNEYSECLGKNSFTLPNFGTSTTPPPASDATKNNGATRSCSDIEKQVKYAQEKASENPNDETIRLKLKELTAMWEKCAAQNSSNTARRENLRSAAPRQSCTYETKTQKDITCRVRICDGKETARRCEGAK